MRWKVPSLLLCIVVLTNNSNAQSVSINTDGSQADASAILDVRSALKGALIPRMLESERTAIVSPATALTVYQTDGISGYYYNSGTAAVPAWVRLSTDKTTVAFSSNTTATQNFNASTYTKIQFNTEEFDESNNFVGGTTSEFTAPVAGIYSFSGLITLQGINGARYDAALFVNDIQKKNTIINMSNGLISIPITGTFKLNAGDRVDLRIWGSAGGSIVGSSPQWVTLSGFKLN